MTTFKESLAFGQDGERDVENWLRYKGCQVLATGDAERNNKGVRLWGQSPTVAPDLMAYHTQWKNWRWIEVKRKGTFSFYRKKQVWTTGLDLHLFKEYKLIHELTQTPVWIFFWHDKSVFDFSARAESPTGLYGNEITILNKNYSHTSDKYGKGGMIYFEQKHLKSITTVEEVHHANDIMIRKDKAA